MYVGRNNACLNLLFGESNRIIRMLKQACQGVCFLYNGCLLLNHYSTLNCWENKHVTTVCFFPKHLTGSVHAHKLFSFVVSSCFVYFCYCILFIFIVCSLFVQICNLFVQIKLNILKCVDKLMNSISQATAEMLHLQYSKVILV